VILVAAADAAPREGPPGRVGEAQS
jgi:hypothetical protein